MASYLNPHGVEVSAADAKIGGKLRPGFKEIIADGERISFDMLFMRDAKPKLDETSIDAVLRERIATMAKNSNMTGAEYLAATSLAEVKRMAAEVAVEVLESMSGQGVASKLADERTKGMADTKAFSAARYAGAPMIEAADGENPTQPSMGARSGVDATATIRSLRYQ